MTSSNTTNSFITGPSSVLPVTPGQLDTLMQEGLHTVIDVINAGEKKLMSLSGFGRKSVTKIRAAIEEQKIAWQEPSE